MINIISTLLLMLSTAVTLAASAKEDSMSRPWFKTHNCSEISIVKFQSLENQKVIKQLFLKDKKSIAKLMQRIEKIPADGDKMKSFSSDAEYILLKFICDKKEEQKIDIIQRRFKTPSTGFNSANNEIENGLYRDIDSLLFPNLDKSILKIEHLEVAFEDFSIAHLGEVERRQKPGEPTIGTITTNSFLVKDKQGKEQELSISHGQITPQPTEFLANGHKYYLLTYENNQGESLYPEYFSIVKEFKKK